MEEELKKSGGDTLEVLPSPVLSLFYRGFYVLEKDVPTLEEYLSRESVKKLIPPDDEFLFSRKITINELAVRELLLVKKEPCLRGDAITDAVPGIGTQRNPTESRVDLYMTSQAQRRWAMITGANVGRRIAIVLDGVIQSAPVVMERIVGGRSQIEMGGSRIEDARDLALIIRAGALPAPVKIVEEYTVGPTLGSDSIRMGIRACYIGAIVVVIFMLIYYATSGLIANFALFLNIFFLLAILSGFRLTLTLPGLAGIALVVGTAVDANVLIFERIREELRSGKTIRTAIDAGFKNAFRTIVDANLTTVMMSCVLWWKGTGPIKGFGVTLTLGTLINIFSATFVTKLIMDTIIKYFRVKRLSI